MDSISLTEVPSPAHRQNEKITFSIFFGWIVIVGLSTLITGYVYSLVWNLCYHRNTKIGCENITKKHERDATSKIKDVYKNQPLAESREREKHLKEIKIDWNTYAIRVNSFIRIITFGRVKQALYLYPEVKGRRFFHCSCCNKDDDGNQEWLINSELSNPVRSYGSDNA